MNLFYIESPFQLLSAFEASKVFGEGRYIIRLSGVEVNDFQLQNLVNFLKIKNYEFLYLPVRKINFNAIIKILKNRMFYYEKIFLGNYDSKFMKIILSLYSRDKVCLLDDGTKTIFIQNRIFNNKKYYDMFTIFNKLKAYENQKLCFNDFKTLKLFINPSFRNDSILFIGSKLVELNMIDKEEYLNTLINVYNKFKLPILYIAHRGEDLSKLEDLQIEINPIFFDYPIELYGHIYSIPNIVISYYSTALFSLRCLYGAESYYINYNFKKEIVSCVYEYFKQTDIKELKF